jgi:hypothetical protein
VLSFKRHLGLRPSEVFNDLRPPGVEPVATRSCEFGSFVREGTWMQFKNRWASLPFWAALIAVLGGPVEAQEAGIAVPRLFFECRGPENIGVF